ncbi:MAG: tRNA lysidine(34) synthetase TilS [Rhodocyclaceae bacterium]|nr:tRNA lysidine(34) synthetase TilS [Rhodocyclaceae bacterium]
MASSRNNNPPADLPSRVARRLAPHVRRGDRLAVGLSGGVDSVVLLHLLRELSPRQGFALSAWHIHHGLSAQADQWQIFCERLCATLEVPLQVRRVQVELGQGCGLEAAARQARYAVFADIDAEWLALAHQRDDRIETMLFNLLRGSGPNGAAGMPAWRPVAPGSRLRLIRPLLDESREELARHAARQGLEWIVDDSNADLRHARNYLRLEVLPLLRKRFPGCDETLARAAVHFSETDRLLEQLAAIDAETACKGGRIAVAELARLGEARAGNLLRHVMKQAGLPMPDRARLQEAVRQLCHAAPDRQVAIDLGERVLRRHRGEAWLIGKIPPAPEREWRGETVLPWGDGFVGFAQSQGQGIRLDRLAGQRLVLRRRRGGERIQPDPRRPRRELGKFLQEAGMPPWERETLPLLCCGDEMVWAPGIGIDCAWRCEEGEAGLLPDWQPRNKSRSP